MTDLTIVLRGTERVSELNGLLPSKARICRFTLEIGVHIEFTLEISVHIKFTL